MTMINTRSRIGALALSLALVGAGAPTMAEETTPEPETLLTLSDPKAVLSLPAGDGVRDSASFALAADSATTVSIDIVGQDGSTVLSSLAPISLTETALTANVTVNVAGLPAGLLSVKATPVLGAPVFSPLRVGSGKPTKATVSLNPRTIHTWSGSSARSTVATVSAVDETNLAIPFTGTVTAVVGSAKYSVAVASPRGAAATATIPASKLKAGSGKVTASVTANGGKATSSAASLTVRATAIASTKVARSTSVVYPTKDGYKDSVKLTATSTTTTGSAIPVTGTVKILNSKGKTVKTWKLSSSKTWSGVWNGKTGSRVVYGKYTVKTSLKGPEGATRTASTTVQVKKGKLVSKSLKTTVKANKILTAYIDLGDWDYNDCWQNYYVLGDIFCDGDDSIDGLSLMASGTRTVPTAVVNAQKYGGAKVRITAKVSSLYGDAAWGYAPVGKDLSRSAAIRSTGNTSPGWLSLPATTKKLDVLLGLGEYSFVGIQTFTVEYSYKVLSTK